MQAGKPPKKQQAVNVYVRQRPMSKQEIDTRSPCVVEITSNHELLLHHNNTKRYLFERVIGPDYTQAAVYHTVLKPFIEEVLQGYNCTVFAYGQTGTGKTYTVSGATPPTSHNNWAEDREAGLISRAAADIFKQLSKPSIEESTVTVSFIELYNEELFDLLADTSSTTLRIYEDPRAKGSVLIQHLSQHTVCSGKEIFDLLQRGIEKRKTASTLLNHQSSRSHSVFTITVYTKEILPSGDCNVKSGKLNLVDLAGSENVGRSGAVNTRAREAGNINQSLLALGRVITALVEEKQHIPYRDSKLTRILQDSLGGRTKTCIIATISPSLACVEETISTLEYAYRARNILNCPEANTKVNHTHLITTLSKEAERLRRDLAAARSGAGFYVDPQNYKQLQEKLELNKKAVILGKDAIAKLEKDKHELEELIQVEQEQYNLLVQSFAFTKAKKNEYKLKALRTQHELKLQRNLKNVYEEKGRELVDQNKSLLNMAEVSNMTMNELYGYMHNMYSKSLEDFQEIEALHQALNTGIANIKCTSNEYSIDAHVQQMQDDVGCLVLEKDGHLLANSESNSELCELKLEKEQTENLHDELKQIHITHKNKITDHVNDFVVDTNKMINAKINGIKNSDVQAYVDFLRPLNELRRTDHRNIALTMKSICDEQKAQIESSINLNRDTKTKTSIDWKRFNKVLNAEIENTDSKIKELTQAKELIEIMITKQKKYFSGLKNLLTQTKLSELSKNISDIDAIIKKEQVLYEKVNSIPDQIEQIDDYEKYIESSQLKQNEEIDKYMRTLEDLKKLLTTKTVELQGSFIQSAETRGTNAVNQIERTKNQVLENLTGIADTASETAACMNDYNKQFNSYINSEKEFIEKLAYREEFMETVEKSLTNENDNVQQINHHLKELSKIKPTGNTPQKRDYHYGKELMECMPDNRILTRCSQDADTSTEILDISDCQPSSISALEELLREENITINESLSSAENE